MPESARSPKVNRSSIDLMALASLFWAALRNSSVRAISSSVSRRSCWSRTFERRISFRVGGGGGLGSAGGGAGTGWTGGGAGRGAGGGVALAAASWGFALSPPPERTIPITIPTTRIAAMGSATTAAWRRGRPEGRLTRVSPGLSASRSRTSSSAAPWRAAGSLAIIFEISAQTPSGIAGSIRRGETGSSLTCLRTIDSGVSPSKTRRPVTRWYRVAPSE